MPDQHEIKHWGNTSWLLPDQHYLGPRAQYSAIWKSLDSARALRVLQDDAFFQKQVFWDGYEKAVSETFSGSLSLTFEIIFVTPRHAITLSIWFRIVEDYFSSKLIRNSDKLVALEGLAELLHKQTGNDYVAGMWRQNLENMLCQESKQEKEEKRIVSYVTLIWSWASLNRSIQVWQ